MSSLLDFYARIKKCHADLLTFVRWTTETSVTDNCHNLAEPAQMPLELSLSMMLYEDLAYLGWSPLYTPRYTMSRRYGNPPQNLEGEYTVVHGMIDYGNQWLYAKGDKRLLVLFGDGLSLDLYRTPDICIVDTHHFHYPAGKVLSLCPEMYGFYMHTIRNYPQERSPTKLYNCFVASPSMLRQTWLYEFTRQGLLDQGNVSYWVASRSESDFMGNLQAKLQTFDKHLHHPANEIFESEHQWLRSRLPFCNFDSSIEQAIMDSKISLAIEMDDNRTEHVVLTEKTFRALMMPRPFLIFMPGYKVGIIQHLRDIGFQVHDDLVDHSYDFIEDPVRRIPVMIEQIKKMCDIDFDLSLRNRLQNRAVENCRLIGQLRSELPNRYAEIIKEIGSID